MKAIVLGVRNKVETIWANSTATKNRPLKFRILVMLLFVADITLMIYCMVNLIE
jgi:hypothetical protein